MSGVRKVILNDQTRAIMRTLSEFATDGDFTGAMDVIREAMVASQRVRMQERDKNGNLQYEDIPDHRVRLAAAALFLECTVVKPVQQLEIAGGGGSGAPTPGSEAKLMEAMMSGGNWDRVKEIGDKYVKNMKRATAAIEVAEVKPKPPGTHLKS